MKENLLFHTQSLSLFFFTSFHWKV